MSTKNKEKEEKPKEENSSKQNEETKKEGTEEKNKEDEKDKKIKRAERFGLLVEKESPKNAVSTEDELNKRKERFKDELAEIEGEEKNKVKSERGRIKHNNFRRNNNYKSNFGGSYRKSHRDYRKGGGFHERRFRGERKNNYYKK